MQTIPTIGFDIAKSVFQVHGVDAAGEVVGALTAPPSMALACRWISRPQHQKRK
jgi:hypothetical protein